LSLLAPEAAGAVGTGASSKTTGSKVEPVIGAVADPSVSLAPAASPFLSEASELANRGRFMEAVALCERQLRENGPTAAAYCLLGMIWQAAGDRTRAEESFRKTVYLDPNHDEALLALALLAERRGDQNAAAGFRRRAERNAMLSRKRVN
jgi:chemotaxis protein methyltransferase WspC